eukprot:6580536-Ditylum_brightwellii.AAC.1
MVENGAWGRDETLWLNEKLHHAYLPNQRVTSQEMLDWEDDQWKGSRIVTPGAPLMQRQVSEESLLLQWFNARHHAAHSTVGGVPTGHWTVAYPKEEDQCSDRLLCYLQTKSIR